jgi:hypothetical protein
MDLKLQPISKAFYTFLNKKWHFDQIVNELIVVKVMNFGYLTSFQSLDKGLIERMGPTGFTVSTFSLASNYTNINSGILHHTTFTFVAFAVLFLAFFTLGSLGILSVSNVSFLMLFVSYILLLLADSN